MRFSPNSGILIIPFLIQLLLLLFGNVGVDAFTTTTTITKRLSCSSQFLGNRIRFIPPQKRKLTTRTKQRRSSTSSSLQMFLGTDGGILGVGTPEVFTILLVGYFVLGPNDLYKLTKEVGKFVQNFRTLGSEASKTLETNLESQLELEEIRKAQRNLNDAFSFRRTINVDDDDEVFPSPYEEKIDTPLRNTSKKRKIRIRKRKKKVVVEEPKLEEEEEEEEEDDEEEDDEEEDDEEDEEEEIVNNIPDLDMASSFNSNTTTNGKSDSDALRAERMQRLKSGQPATESWFDNDTNNNSPFATPAAAAESNSRFAQQLSGEWNQSILQNEDKLGPLANVMEKIALLEEQKQSADLRLQEEFRLRKELEEKFYIEKREVLEQAATQVQTDAYTSTTTTTNNTATATTTESVSMEQQPKK